MKTAIKRVISVALVVVMVFGMVPLSAFVGFKLPEWINGSSLVASAASKNLAQLKEKYPNGKYWNHVGSSSNNPNGWTNTPCPSHNSTSTCNGFVYNGTTLGWQCFGFALQLGYDAYGSNPKNWGRAYNLDNIKPGDIINYDGTNPGHTVFVTHVNGDTVTIAECNYGARCIIKWGRTLKKSEFYNLYNVYVAPYSLDNNTTKTLSVYYNANGGSISSDTYKLSSNLIYNKSDSTKYVQTWKYNNAKENGLVNKGTFGLSRTGYTFVGWGTKASGGTVLDPDNTALKPSDICADIKNGSCSVTLYAQWKPNTLNVYYNVNGGTITSDKYKSISNIAGFKDTGKQLCDVWTYNSKKENGLYNASTFGLAKPGYKFVGWGTKASGGAVYGQSDNSLVPTTLNSNIKNGHCELVLYAQWEPNTLQVYYNANGGSVSSDTYKLSSNIIYNKSDSTKYAQKWTYNNPKDNGLINKGTFGLSRTGYTFVGWGTKASGGTVLDPDNTALKPSDICADIKNGSCSVTLYAQWIPNTLTVYYNANGGSLLSDKYLLSSGVIYKKADSAKFAHIWTYNTTPTNGLTNDSTFGLYRTGYTFAGWSTKTSGGTIFGQNDTTLVSTDFTSTIKSKSTSVTMYAQWTPNEVTLHYQSAGEMLCQSHTVSGSGKVLTAYPIERTDSSHLKYNGKMYTVTGTKKLTMTYGTPITGISIKDAGISLSEHTGCGYIAFRDCDSKWRVIIDGEKKWCTEDEINAAISKKSFEGYALYSQGSTHGNIAPSGDVYFYAVWVDSHTHSYKLTATTNATCTEKDTKIYTCSCGDSYTVKGNALGHDYKTVVTVPTCETSGFTTHICLTCGDSYTDSEKNATGHSYKKSQTKAPTCTQVGVCIYVCSCGDSYTEEINENGHTYSYQVIEPTCTDNGYTYISCSECGESKIDNIVEITGHSFESEVIAPTCTEEGYTQKTCSVCYLSERCEVVEAIGHTYGDWITILEPHNTYEGAKAKICNVCSHTLFETIPQIPFCKVCPYCYIEYNDIFEYNTHIWDEEYSLDIILPSQVVIPYGDSIIVHADVGYAFKECEGMYHIEWSTSNDCFKTSVSDDEMSAMFSPSTTGTTTITVKLCDEDGNVINEAMQVLTSKAGFFDKLIAFFKSIFGLTKVIPQ